MTPTEQLLRDALELGLEAAEQVAFDTHEKFKGYKPQRHAAVDADVEKIKAAIAMLVATSQQAEGEPVEYQYRTRPMWEQPGRGWTQWERCSAGSYADYVKSPIVNDWEWEVRALVLAAPLPAQQEAVPTNHIPERGQMVSDSEILRIALLRTDAGLNRGTWTFTDKDVIAFARALSRTAPVVAEGWKLVPVIGTKGMMIADIDCAAECQKRNLLGEPISFEDAWQKCWAAMLAASPSAAQGEGT